MGILYIGDFITKNGPSIVDINLTNNFEKNKIFKEQINKKINLNLIKKICFSDIILISGVSLKGLMSIVIGKIFFKKSLFIMHGSLKEEEKFHKVAFKRKAMEQLQLIFSNRIICVSELFSKKVKKIYRIEESKISFIDNGVEEKTVVKIKIKRENLILTTGGGRKEKGVLNVAKAINEIKNLNLELIVVGEKCQDTEEIKKFKFVKYLNFLDYEKLMVLMEETNIFIQNSIYEPFGMAPLEAAQRGCKIIVSKDVCSRELLEQGTYYCVEDNNDIDEIKINILNAINSSVLPIFKERRTWEYVAKEYMDEIKNVLKG